jgi:hypothetical protein
MSAARSQSRSSFDFPAKRRKEIVLHGRLVGAMDSDDRDRWLIAWHWHNPKAIDPIWSLMEAAKRMGGNISEAEASAITEEASITRKHLSADNLARFLGVTYKQRQHLGSRPTIGSIDVKKRARKELRKRQNSIAHEKRRRAFGMRPQSQSLSATKPWEVEGVCRRTWERRRNRPVATLSASIFLSNEDRPATPEGGAGLAERGFASKEARGLPSSQTATTMVADRYEPLPMELRLLALGLPVPGRRQGLAA